MDGIAGTGMNKKQLLIVGGIGALGVGVVVYLRYKAGQDAPAQGFPDATPESSGGGGGYSMPTSDPVSVNAPTQGVADWFTQQMQAAELAAANLQNEYGGEQLRQNRLQFELGQREAQANFDIESGVRNTYADLVTTQIGKVKETLTSGRVKVECGKNEQQYIDVNGQLACKASGKSGIKSIGDKIGGGIMDVVGGFFSGAAGAARQYGAYEVGQVTGMPTAARPQVAMASKAPANQKTIGKPEPSHYDTI